MSALMTDNIHGASKLAIDKIREAAAREEARTSDDFDDGDLQQVEDRALLLVAVPDLIRENERLAEVAAIRQGQIKRQAEEIERLKQYECGDIIPGKVVSDNLAAAGRWIAQETERCAGICEAMIVGGRNWNEVQFFQARLLRTAAANIRAPVSPRTVETAVPEPGLRDDKLEPWAVPSGDDTGSTS